MSKVQMERIQVLDQFEQFKKLSFSQLLLLHIKVSKEDEENKNEDFKEPTRVEHQSNKTKSSIFAHPLCPIRIPNRADQRLLLKLKKQPNFNNSNSQLSIKHMMKLEKLQALAEREEKELKREREEELQDNLIEVQIRKKEKLATEFAIFKNWAFGNH